MQTIQDFYRVAQTRGFSRDFMLRVRSIGDASGQNTAFNEDDFVYIMSGKIPDRNITNQDLTYMGLKFNLPGTVTFPGSEGWDVKFHNDLNGSIRSRLEDWQDTIFNADLTSNAQSTGNLALPGTDRVLQLDLIDENQNTLNTYCLYGVYIQALGAPEYDMAGSGKPIDFAAKLAYQFWSHTLVAPTPSSYSV